MAGLLGRVDYYDSGREEWTQYVERLEHFLTTNGVETVQRFRFHTRMRKNGESIATYMAELRSLAGFCN